MMPEQGHPLDGQPVAVGETPFLGGQVATGGMPQQVMTVQHRDSLPIVIGVIFGLWNLLLTGIAGLVVLGGLWLADAGADAGVGEATEVGAFIIVLGIIMALLGLVGVYAGVEIARYKKKGVFIGLGLLGLSVVLSIVSTTSQGAAPDMFNVGCNGLCALFIALPLMISSIGAQME